MARYAAPFAAPDRVAAEEDEDDAAAELEERADAAVSAGDAADFFFARDFCAGCEVLLAAATMSILSCCTSAAAAAGLGVDAFANAALFVRVDICAPGSECLAWRTKG
jgi:hypothetical protein